VPLTFLSHQAAVLPLKLARPRRYSGAALVLGSVAPDAPKFVLGPGSDTFTHSVVGQLVWCLPFTVAMLVLVRHVIAAPLGRYLPDLGPFHLGDYAALAADPNDRVRWRVVVVSALVGSFSHVGWDLLTHQPGWPPVALTIAGRTVLGMDLMQYVSSAIGMVATIAMLLHIGRSRLVLRWRRRGPPRHVRRMSAGTAALRWIGLALVVAVSVALSFAVDAEPGPLTSERHLSTLLLRVPAFAFLILTVACAVATWRGRLRERRTDDARVPRADAAA
jgi:hypothetical protein